MPTCLTLNSLHMIAFPPTLVKPSVATVTDPEKKTPEMTKAVNQISKYRLLLLKLGNLFDLALDKYTRNCGD